MNPLENFFQRTVVPTHQIDISRINSSVSLYVRREDLIHPEMSGNKFRKLKYNLIRARDSGFKKILTFGGAYSNHICAVAAAGKHFGFETIGVIRGDELKHRELNPTLKTASKNGMKLHFVTRDFYRKKEEEEQVFQLKENFGEFYLLPEGGTNSEAVKGCMEILQDEDRVFDYICLPAGTGGTLAGILEASEEHQEVIGFSVLNGVFQEAEVKRFSSKKNYKLTADFSFGGYGKIERELVRFINEFKSETKIPLDPIYTGKMFYGIYEYLKDGFFKENSRILAIHTGGLQGVAGANEFLLQRKLPLIQ